MVPNEDVIRICAEYPERLYPMAKINLWDTAPDPAELYYFADSPQTKRPISAPSVILIVTSTLES